MAKKVTLKELVLRFVEEKGSARFTDIQRFIVDTSHGEGAYERGKHYEHQRIRNKPVLRCVNSWRGTFCMAFIPDRGYLMLGKQYLEKRGKLYYTVRDGVWKRTPPKHKFRYGHPYRDTNIFPKEIITNPTNGRVSGPGAEEPMIRLHVHNTDPIDNIHEVGYVVGNLKGPSIDTNEGHCIEQPVVSEPHLTIYNKELDVSVVVNDKEVVALIDGAPLSGFKKEENTKKDIGPGYCRWCGHSIHPSHFETDRNGTQPNYCHWCGHTL